MKASLPDRIWPHVSKADEDSCWIWTKGKNDKGYGIIVYQRRARQVHRLVFEMVHGAIPDGFGIVHRCGNHACVNPVHLEAKSIREIVLSGNGPCAKNRRKTHCRRGHPLDGDNLCVSPTGGRTCKICRNEIAQRHREKKRLINPPKKRTYVRKPKPEPKTAVRNPAYDLTPEEIRFFKTKFGGQDHALCWPWFGRLNSYGYGVFTVHRYGQKTHLQAHRVSYEIFVGIIPPGLVIDHLCRNRRCVNPHHLEPVTHVENLRRGEGWSGKSLPQPQSIKTHCPQGHAYDAENTSYYVSPRGYKHRRCKTCLREWARRDRERRKASTESAIGEQTQ